MADPGFPGQHTTTTTVQTSNTTVVTTLRFDSAYIRTLPGILKCVQLLLSLGCAISLDLSVTNGTNTFPILIASLTIVVTSILLLLYSIHYVEKHHSYPWLTFETIYYFSATGCFFLVLVFAALATRYGSYEPTILNLLGFICIECSGVLALHTRGSFFNFVAMFAFWFTGILLVLYLFHVIEKFYKIPWLKIEFLYCAVWTGFYLIASSLAVSFGAEAFIAAGFFGFCAMVAYGFDAFTKFKGIQSGALAQGERVISKQTSTLTSPAY